VENIIADIASLGLRYEKLSYTSDYFPQMLDLAERLIKAGHLYADDTPVDKMREVSFCQVSFVLICKCPCALHFQMQAVRFIIHVVLAGWLPPQYHSTHPGPCLHILASVAPLLYCIISYAFAMVRGAHRQWLRFYIICWSISMFVSVPDFVHHSPWESPAMWPE
jgi:hypothetical protein